MSLNLDSTQLQTLRSDPQTSRIGLLVFRPPVIVRARISGSHDRGATTINVTIDEIVSSPAYHYTVIVGRSDGDDSGGKLRFKSMTGSTIKVSNNSIVWDDYTHIGVLRVIDPKSVLPDLNNTMMDGDIPYTSQNEQTHPLAHIGPPAWGYVGEPIKFYSDSRVTKSGASVSLHSWSFPDSDIGSSTDAGSFESPIEATWDYATGHIPHYITYTCIDSNGRSHTRYNPVWILDEFTDAYCNLEPESISGSFDAGTWSMTLTVRGAATAAEFPKDAMVMLIAEDTFNWQPGSVGNRWGYRDNILFVGWITKATTIISVEDAVRFEAEGPMGILDKMTGWPANLKDGNPHVPDQLSSPWDNIPGMTCDLAAFHIITERSTVDHICDVWLTGSSRRLRYVDIPEGKISSQLTEYCLSPIGAMAISDAHGSIYCDRNPNLMPMADRSSVPTVMTLQLGDIIEDPGAELEAEEFQFRAAQLDFIGFYYNGGDATPYYSLAPPIQYESGDIKKIDGIRADSQDETNELAGMYLANENNQWRQIKLPMYNYRVFDIAPQAYTIFPLETSENLRGIDWSFGQKVIARTVEYDFDPEKRAIFVSVVFEADSYGPPGVGGGYPTSLPKAAAKPLAPDPIALAAWGSFWFQKNTDPWEGRGGLQTTLHGCVDVWWRDISKANTRDVDWSWLWACGAEGLLAGSRDGGRSWLPYIAPAPDQDYFDLSGAPPIDICDLTCVVSDRYRNGRFYLAASINNDDGQFGWLGISEDNFTSITWVVPFDGVPDNLKVLWVDSNQSYILVTVWTDSNIICLIVLDATDYSHLATYELGDATLEEISLGTFVCYPVCVGVDVEEWYLAGRVDYAYDALTSGVAHVVRRTAGDVWDIIEDSWGSHKCIGFAVEPDGDNRVIYGLEMT